MVVQVDAAGDMATALLVIQHAVTVATQDELAAHRAVAACSRAGGGEGEQARALAAAADAAELQVGGGMG